MVVERVLAFQFFHQTKAVAAEMKNSDLRHELDVKNAIAQESKKVKIMVDNMQQALFPVDSKGNIVEPVSNYSSGLFGGPVVNKNIANKDTPPLAKNAVAAPN